MHRAKNRAYDDGTAEMKVEMGGRDDKEVFMGLAWELSETGLVELDERRALFFFSVCEQNDEHQRVISHPVPCALLISSSA
jgi:hypothetical protein